MATINGYTAERMKEIEDSAIVDGDVIGDNLVLKRFDGGEINAGSVRGPTGSPGISSEELADQLAIFDPPGIPKPYTGATAPSGYGICDSVAEYTGTTYPVLAALYGTGSACINGTAAFGKFRLPNLRGRVLVGRDPAVAAFDTLHETGGSRDSVVVTHTHTASTDSLKASGVNSYMGGSDAFASDATGNVVVDASGVSGVNANLPPYRVINYIMRLA